MPTAAEFQSSLDRMLASRGRVATLQRRSGVTVTMTAPLKVFKRGYMPGELVAGTGITQGDTKIVMSNTDLIKASWPGGNPRAGDFILVDGVTLRVIAAPVRPMDVGFDIQARG